MATTTTTSTPSYYDGSRVLFPMTKGLSKRVGAINDSLIARTKLRQHDGIQRALADIWYELPKDQFLLSKETYVKFYSYVSLTLIKDISIDKATLLSQRDWIYDSDGVDDDRIDYDRFLNSLFEVADLFVPVVDAEAYIAFLSRISQSVFDNSGGLKNDFVPTTDNNNTIMVECATTSDLLNHSLKSLLAELHSKIHRAEPSEKANPVPLPSAAQTNNSSLEPDSNNNTIIAHYERKTASINTKASAANFDTEDEISLLQATGPTVTITGPRVSGKSTLAASLASHLNVRCLSVESALAELWTAPPLPAPSSLEEEQEEAEESPTEDSPEEESVEHRDPVIQAIVAKLKEGLEPTVDDGVYTLLSKVLELSNRGEGYVLDNVQPNLLERSNVASVLKLDQLEHSLLDFHLTLNLSDNDVKIRAAGLKVNPETGVVYSERDIANIVDKEKKGTTGFAEKLPLTIPAVSVVDEATASEEEEEAGQAADSNEEKDDEHLEEESFETLNSFPTFQQAECDTSVLQPLVPETTADAKSSNNFSGCNVELNAAQSATGLLQEAVFRICGKSPAISQLPPTLRAFHVPLSSGVESSSTVEQMRWLLYADIIVEESDQHLIATGEPRKVSAWRNICPVAKLYGKIVPGSTSNAVFYAGHIFLLASADAMKSFIEYPRSYLSSLPINDEKKVVLVFEPSTATNTTEFSLSLASKLNLKAFDATGASSPEEAASSAYEKFLAEDSKEHYGCLVYGLQPHLEVPSFFAAKVDVVTTHAIGLNITMVDEEPSEITEFNGKLQELKAASEETSLLITTLSLGADSNSDAVEDAVSNAACTIDPLLLRADDEVVGWISQDEAAISEAEETMRASVGEASKYCAVTLKRLGRLVPGSAETPAAYVKQRKYTFAGEEELEAFKRNAEKYIPTASTILPVPIVLLLGLECSGKSVQSNFLREQLDAEILCYTALTAAYEEIQKKEMESQEVENLDSDTKSDLFFTAIEKCIADFESSKRRPSCFVIPGLGFDDDKLPSESVLETCVAKRLLPTFVLPLSISKETFISRQMSLWSYVHPEVPASEEGEEEEESVSEEEKKLALKAAITEAKSARLVELEGRFDTATELLSTAVDKLRTANVTILPEVSANGTKARVSKRVCAKLSPTLQESILSSASPISFTRAQELLKKGYVSLGQYKTSCPIDASSSSVKFPVLNQKYIYFPSSEANQKKFCSNFNTRTVKSVPETVPPQVAVTGAGYSGKTTLAKSLANSLDLVYLTLPNVLEWVTCCLGGTELWQKVQGRSKDNDDGSSNFDLITAEALAMRIHSSECQINGYVLDGFPSCVSDIKLAEKFDIMPQTLLWIDTSVEELGKRSSSYSEATYTDWKNSQKQSISYLMEHYGTESMKVVDGNKSKWGVSRDATSIIKEVASREASYRQSIASGKAGRVAGIQVPTFVLGSKINPDFGFACPVALHRNKIQRFARLNDRKFVAEFKSNFYWCSTEEAVKAFSDSPLEFLDPVKLQLPIVSISIGSTIPEGNTPKQLALKGYCPVTFKHGAGPQDWSSIVKGSPHFLAAYEDKFYSFASDEKRRVFIQSPEDFLNQTLPVKLPPDVPPQDLTNLPGQLEQIMSGITNEALAVLGKNRLKFPCTSMEKSAVMHLALWLKANNPKNSAHKEVFYRKLLDSFEEDCGLAEIIKGKMSVGSALQGVRAVKYTADKQYIAVANRFDSLSNGNKSEIQEYAKSPFK